MKIRTGIKELIILFIIVLIAVSCRGLSSEKEACPIENLLISSSDLPGNQWEEVGSRSYRDAPTRLGIDRIGTGFSTPRYGVAEENVYRFKDENDANEGFLRLYDMWGRLVLDSAVWSPINLPSDVNINADDIHLECSIEGENKVKTCWYLARYNRTVVEFISTMIIVSDNDFFDVIQTLDLKMMNCEE